MQEKNKKEVVKFWQTFRKNEPLIVMSFKPAMIGVFTNEEALENALNKKSITSVYTPLNEVKKDVLSSLPKNELCKMTTGCGIAAKDIKTLTHLFVDIDVVGLQEDGKKRNATKEEHEEARQVAINAKAFLSNAGFPSPILVDSANGFHLLYQIDLKATKENEKIIANVLKAVAEKADSEKAKIDTVVFDRGRKVKMSGSSNNVGEENYRMSTIIEVPDENIVVSLELLNEVAKLCKNKKNGWENSKGKMLTIEEGMAEIAEQAGEYFVSDTGQFFVNIHIDENALVTYNLRDDEFRYHMRRIFKDVLNLKIIDARDWSGLLEYLEVVATSNRNNVRIYNRIGQNEDGILYNLINNNYESVLITTEGYEIINTPAGVFQRNSTDLPQVEPIFDENFDFWGTMKSLFNFKDDSELQLFVLWLVCTYIPDIAKPILLITGPHGSSKSTACSMIQELVSPQVLFRSTFPKKTDDLAVRLANRAICVYDNCSRITPEQSDLLCSASTFGSYEKRKLYTDQQLISIPLRSSIVLNSCEALIERQDLLSRTLQFNMSTLSGEKLLSDDEMKKRFEEAKPYLLGSIFMCLSYYLTEKDSLNGQKIDYVMRMTQFQKCAMIVGHSAFEMDYEEVCNLLTNNKKNINIQVLETNPVSYLILTFMKDKDSWTGSVSDLYNKLDLLAFELGIEKGNKLYPRHAASLSMRLNSLTSMLEQAGITFQIKPSATYKQITIKNKNSILMKKKPKSVEDLETDIDKELGL